MRIVLFTGKGGVGKTTISAATALVAATQDHSTLLISTDVAHSLSDALDLELVNAPKTIAPGLDAAELDTAQELDQYWGEIRERLTDALEQAGIEAPIAAELAVLPGLDELLALVRIKTLYDRGDYDLLVVDSAPTGAAMRLLAAPDLAKGYAKQLASLSGGIVKAVAPTLKARLGIVASAPRLMERLTQVFDSVEALRQLLLDGDTTSVRLVLNPERMAIKETQRAFTYMSLFGLSVDALFLNRLYPDELADPYLADWRASQREHVETAQSLFSPLPIYQVPLHRREIVGPKALLSLGQSIYAGRDPADRLSREELLQIQAEEDGYLLRMRVVGVLTGSVQVERRGSDLYVQLGTLRRSVPLPQMLMTYEPSWARVSGGYLLVAFAPRSST